MELWAPRLDRDRMDAGDELVPRAFRELLCKFPRRDDDGNHGKGRLVVAVVDDDEDRKTGDIIATDSFDETDTFVVLGIFLRDRRWDGLLVLEGFRFPVVVVVVVSSLIRITSWESF